MDERGKEQVNNEDAVVNVDGSSDLMMIDEDQLLCCLSGGATPIDSHFSRKFEVGFDNSKVDLAVKPGSLPKFSKE